LAGPQDWASMSSAGCQETHLPHICTFGQVFARLHVCQSERASERQRERWRHLPGADLVMRLTPCRRNEMLRYISREVGERQTSNATKSQLHHGTTELETYDR
jgi:hypothetical protein